MYISWESTLFHCSSCKSSTEYTQHTFRAHTHTQNVTHWTVCRAWTYTTAPRCPRPGPWSPVTWSLWNLGFTSTNTTPGEDTVLTVTYIHYFYLIIYIVRMDFGNRWLNSLFILFFELNKQKCGRYIMCKINDLFICKFCLSEFSLRATRGGLWGRYCTWSAYSKLPEALTFSAHQRLRKWF